MENTFTQHPSPGDAHTAPSASTLAEVEGWGATIDVPTACGPLGISKSHGYDLVARGEFPARVITVGRRYRVITADLLRLLGATDGAA